MPRLMSSLGVKNRNLVLCIVLLLFQIGTNIACADFAFDKTRFVFTLQKPIDSIKLTNNSTTKPLNIVTRVVSWTQSNGNDVYVPTKDLIVSPPSLVIPPDNQRLVRVGWRKPALPKEEIAYRLFLTDTSPYEVALGKNSVQLRMDVSIPIFIPPSDEVVQAQWQVTRQGGSQIKVVVTNTGNVHIKVKNLTITNTNNEVIANQPTIFYILPHQSKQGVLGVTKQPGQAVTISADTDQGTLSATVNVI